LLECLFIVELQRARRIANRKVSSRYAEPIRVLIDQIKKD